MERNNRDPRISAEFKRRARAIRRAINVIISEIKQFSYLGEALENRIKYNAWKIVEQKLKNDERIETRLIVHQVSIKCQSDFIAKLQAAMNKVLLDQ